MHTSSILPAPRDVETDGTTHAASASGALLRRAGLAIWRALEASGEARALRELRSMHGRWELSNPEFAGQVRDGSVFGTPAHPHH